MFWLVVSTIPAISLLWWYFADLALREYAPRLRYPRLALAAFMLLHIAYFAYLIASRRAGWTAVPPMAVTISGYVWHLVVVPIVVIPWVFLFGGARTWGAVQRLRRTVPLALEQPDSEAELALGDGLTRRQFLGLSLVAAPPLLTAAGTAVAMRQIDGFTVRSIDLPLANLPPALDGLRIVHLSDLHVGRFTKGELLDRIVAAANGADPDLIVVTGDIIDHALRDLPEAVAALQKLQARHGVYTCEGNHDLFEGRDAFRAGMREGGLKLLTNQWERIEIGGASLGIGGIAWGKPGQRRGVDIEGNMAELLAARPASDFSILLAHHPHAFDNARAAGIPLTFAGHTHGGQLMLTRDIGAGPMMFKYWSGGYGGNDARLVVSNGVGNWMPLRINAPAEIVVATLARA